MLPEQHEALYNHLMDEMNSPGDCDHSLRRTKQFLAGVRNCDVAGAIGWLRERGGYCDCEVLMNTMPMDEVPNAGIQRASPASGEAPVE